MTGLLKNILFHFAVAQILNNLSIKTHNVLHLLCNYVTKLNISSNSVTTKQLIDQKFWMSIPQKVGDIYHLILLPSYPDSPIHHITVVVIFTQDTHIPVSSLHLKTCCSPVQWVAWRPPGRLPGPGAGLLSCRRSWGSNQEAVALAPGWHQSHTEDHLQAIRTCITCTSHEYNMNITITLSVKRNLSLLQSDAH